MFVPIRPSGLYVNRITPLSPGAKTLLSYSAFAHEQVETSREITSGDFPLFINLYSYVRGCSSPAANSALILSFSKTTCAAFEARGGLAILSILSFGRILICAIALWLNAIAATRNMSLSSLIRASRYLYLTCVQKSQTSAQLSHP